MAAGVQFLSRMNSKVRSLYFFYFFSRFNSMSNRSNFFFTVARAEITGGSEVTKMVEIMSWTFSVCVILFSVLLCVFLLCVSFFSCVSFSSMCPYSLVYLKFLSSLSCVLLSVCLYTCVVFQCLVRCLKLLLDELFENLASQLIKSYHIISYHSWTRRQRMLIGSRRAGQHPQPQNSLLSLLFLLFLIFLFALIS